MTTDTVLREVLKSKTAKLALGTWENAGRMLVSVASLYLDTDSGEYRRRKGGFALTSAEARELSAALLDVAAVVDGMPPVPPQ